MKEIPTQTQEFCNILEHIGLQLIHTPPNPLRDKMGIVELMGKRRNVETSIVNNEKEGERTNPSSKMLYKTRVILYKEEKDDPK